MTSNNISDAFLKSPVPVLVCNSKGYPTDSNKFVLDFFGVEKINNISTLDIFSILKIKTIDKKNLDNEGFIILDRFVDFEKLKSANILTSKLSKKAFTVFIFLLETKEYVLQFYEKNEITNNSQKINLDNYKPIYKELLKGLPNSIVFQFDKDLKCKIAEGDILKKYKISNKELFDKTLYEISYFFPSLLNEQIEKIITCCQNALDGKEDYFEFKYNNKHVILYTSLINNSEDTYVIALFNDITKSKRFDEVSKDSFQFFQNLIETIPVPIFYKSINGLYLGCNELFLNYLGFKRDEVINKNVYDIITKDLAETYNKSDQDVFETKTKQMLQSNFIHADGYIHDVIFYKAPFFESEDKVIGLVSVMFDITEQKKIEEKLRSSEQRYRTIIEDQTEIIYRLLPNGNITFVNEAFCEFFNTKRKDVIGANIINFLPNFTSEQMFIFINSFTVNNSIFKKIFTMQLKHNRDIKYLHTTNRAIFDNNGKIIELQTVGQDITELKRIENELILAKSKAEDALKLKSSYLSNMSQDIKNPLNAIIGMTSLLFETDLSQEQLELTQIIKRSCESLLEIINDILDFSKMELGKLSFEKKPFNIRTCIEETFKILEAKAKENSVELRYFIKQNVPDRILGDMTRLRQVLLNIVENAIKSTNDGEVFISVNTVKKEKNFLEIQFAVKDTGIGISDKKKLFILNSDTNDFSETNSESYSKYLGTGFGLIISKKMIEMMGGKIWFVSEEKEGSTFFFTIKTVESYDNNNEPEKKVEKASLLSETLPLTILVAEDNSINQKVLLRILSKMGYLPDYVDDGIEVLKKMNNKNYDIIFMDVQMPNLDGIETTKKIREKNKNLPIIIALTANSSQKDKKDCLDCGMNDYLSKPLSIEQVENMLIRWGKKAREGKNMEYEIINIDTLKKVTYISEDNEEDNIEFLLELIDTFITQTPTLIEQIKEYAKNKDIDKIGKVSHTLKGSSLTIGANRFGYLCKNINEESKNGNFPKVSELLPNLDTIYNELEKELLAIRKSKSYNSLN